MAFLTAEHAKKAVRYRQQREAELRRNRGRASPATVEHDVRLNDPITLIPTWRGGKAEPWPEAPAGSEYSGHSDEWQFMQVEPDKPRAKGACPKCGQHIGRGVGLHAMRCGG